MDNYKRQDLEDLIKDVMGISTITPMITKQINRFAMQDWGYKEIARCIVWYVEVAGQTLSPMYGLGILPNIREQADKYFKQLELDQRKQEAEAKKIAEYQDNNIIFHIKNLKHEKRKPKQFNIEEINIEGESTNGNN